MQCFCFLLPQVLSAAGQHQVLIFVHSRKETAKTARYLKETALANDTLMRFVPVSFPTALTLTAVPTRPRPALGSPAAHSDRIHTCFAARSVVWSNHSL